MKRLALCALLCALTLSAYERIGEPRYEVSGFRIVYDSPHEDQIPISKLMNFWIQLSKGPDGYTAPNVADPVWITLEEFSLEEEFEQSQEPVQGMGRFHSWGSRQKTSYPIFFRSALQEICNTLIRYLNRKGLSGVSIQISPDEIGAEGGDRRGKCHRYLTIRIRTALVGEVGAYRLDGDCLEKKLTQNNRELSYIVSHSPMRPAFEGDGVEGDLFSQDRLDSYLAFLNRHPNRRVDARIYPLNRENRVGIDYLVSENRPWRVFFDIGNTGNHVTGIWQETFGFLHTQLTGVDDVFRLDYTTDSFHSYFTVIGAYDRPILAWPRARWKVFGMFNRYAASDLGFEDKIFVGTQGIVDLGFTENAAQSGSFFFDFIEGIRYYNIHVTNKLALVPKGQTQFAAPTFGFKMEQVLPYWRFYFKFEGVTSPNKFLAGNRDDLDLLGRIDVNKGWTILYSQFLAGVYTSRKKLVHEFVFLGQGQYAFNYRLIPQLKFVVGGFNTARGYPEAINSGDSAFVLRGEYLFHLPPLFTPNPKTKTTLFSKPFRIVPEYTGGRADWDFILRAFVDAARSVDNERIPGLEDNSTLISTGLGAEIDLWQNFMIRGDWGITLQKAIDTDMGHSIVYLNSTLTY